MSIIAGIVGLPIGVVFHRFVMSRILIDTMTYPVIIKPVSYLISFVCTIIFALIVNLFMKRHIRKIDMAESLKAVE